MSPKEIYKRVAEDIELLAANGKWDELRSYFQYYDNVDEQTAKTIAWCKFFLAKFFKDPTPDFQCELVRRYL